MKGATIISFDSLSSPGFRGRVPWSEEDSKIKNKETNWPEDRSYELYLSPGKQVNYLCESKFLKKGILAALNLRELV